MRSVFFFLLVTAMAMAASAGEVEPEPGADAATAEPAAGEGVLAVDEAGVAAPRGYLARATFATAVVDREPWDSIDTLTNDHLRVAYFTEVRDMAGGTITHRWEHGGKVMAEVSFAIGGPRWRVYSTKDLDPSWLGEWTVSVIDAAGNTLETASLSYTHAPAAEESVEAPAAAAVAPPEETAEASASASPAAGSAPPAAPEP